MRSETTRLVVHCSATGPAHDIGAAEISRLHTSAKTKMVDWNGDRIPGRGWSKIGYHFVIRKIGRLEFGRHPNEVGAHARGHNRTSVGICLVGGLDAYGTPAANYTAPQLTTLRELIRTLQVAYPTAELLGHRDLPGVAKACPCFDVAHWYETGELR